MEDQPTTGDTTQTPGTTEQPSNTLAENLGQIDAAKNEGAQMEAIRVPAAAKEIADLVGVHPLAMEAHHVLAYINGLLAKIPTGSVAQADEAVPEQSQADIALGELLKMPPAEVGAEEVLEYIENQSANFDTVLIGIRTDAQAAIDAIQEKVAKEMPAEVVSQLHAAHDALARLGQNGHPIAQDYIRLHPTPKA